MNYIGRVQPAWRPPSPAAGDRNTSSVLPIMTLCIWRSPPAAAEDRNGGNDTPEVWANGGGRHMWRPRIATPGVRLSSRTARKLAAAVRGGRGSQRHSRRGLKRCDYRRRPSAMTVGDRNGRVVLD